MMHNYSIHKTLYDRCNKLKKIHFPISGTLIPNAQYAMEYIIKQLQFETKRERDRSSVYHNWTTYDPTPDHEEYFDAIDYDEIHILRENERRKQKESIKRNIDHGIIMAFDDMCKYTKDIDIFLKKYFDFIKKTFLDSRWSKKVDDCAEYYTQYSVYPYRRDNQYDADADTKEYDGYDRTHFCFYALGYIAHKLWLLFVQNKLILNDDHEVSKYKIFETYNDIMNHQTTILFSDSFANLLERERVLDGIKYEKEWNKTTETLWSAREYTRPEKEKFEECIDFSRLSICDAVWLVNNHALTDKYDECTKMKIFQYAFHICLQRIDDEKTPKSLNKIFKKYLGYKIMTNQIQHTTEKKKKRKVRKRCHRCKVTKVTLKLCARCQNKYYCNRYCQKVAWNFVHRYECCAL